ncbi:hypothetical protein CRG98_007577 [Punica granatum]|uniref:Uncharacterized protein n=1 Tax=Punica granatum TaxID=22663 RepID=A0A2I0KU96_PUNGR|nr:hypothetical protein CRG98_007577 [Punica granatum]
MSWVVGPNWAEIRWVVDWADMNWLLGHRDLDWAGPLVNWAGPLLNEGRAAGLGLDWTAATSELRKSFEQAGRQEERRKIAGFGWEVAGKEGEKKWKRKGKEKKGGKDKNIK